MAEVVAEDDNAPNGDNESLAKKRIDLYKCRLSQAYKDWQEGSQNGNSGNQKPS